MYDELAYKNLTLIDVRETAKKLQASGQGKQYPYLDCEKRIYNLVKKLWECRDAIEIQIQQECPRDQHFDPLRHKEQLIYQVVSYVCYLCHPTEED